MKLGIFLESFVKLNLLYFLENIFGLENFWVCVVATIVD